MNEFVYSSGLAISLQLISNPRYGSLSLEVHFPSTFSSFMGGLNRPFRWFVLNICIKKCCIAQTQLLGRWWSALVTDLSRVLAASANISVSLSESKSFTSYASAILPSLGLSHFALEVAMSVTGAEDLAISKRGLIRWSMKEKSPCLRLVVVTSISENIQFSSNLKCAASFRSDWVLSLIHTGACRSCTMRFRWINNEWIYEWTIRNSHRGQEAGD